MVKIIKPQFEPTSEMSSELGMLLDYRAIYVGLLVPGI